MFLNAIYQNCLIGSTLSNKMAIQAVDKNYL